MKKVLTILAAMALGLSAVACGGDSQTTETIDPTDLKPPMDLTTVSGNNSISLLWQSANTVNDEYAPTAFSIYKADGDLSTDAQTGPFPLDELTDPGNKQAFDASEALDGIQPVALLPIDEAGAVVGMTDVAVPGIIEVVLEDGGDICYPTVTATDAAASGDDSASDDATDTTSARYGAAQTSPTDATGDTGGGGQALGSCPDGTENGGALSITNGSAYTFFVTVRASDDWSGESWTSNWVSDSPRREVENVDLALDDNNCAAFDLDTLAEVATAGDCARDNTLASGTLFVGPAEADFVVVGNGLTGARPRNLIASVNGAGIQDYGFIDGQWAINWAPAEGYMVDTGFPVDDTSVGHGYIIQTDGGLFAKIYVTSNAPGVSISFFAAVQDNGNQLKQ